MSTGTRKKGSPTVVDFNQGRIEQANERVAKRLAEHPTHELELAVLGVALLDDSRWAEVQPHGELLTHARHRRIFRAMERCWRKHQKLDLVLVEAELSTAGEDSAAPYLAKMLLNSVRNDNIRPYVDELRQLRQERQVLKDALAVADLATRGADTDTVRDALQGALERFNKGGADRFQPVEIHTDEVVSRPVEWRVQNLIPSSGLVMIWGQPSAGKTYWLLRLVHELVSEPQPPTLNGHPDLRIRANTRRVLWIACEEDAGRLQDRADRVMAGMGNPDLYGELLHLFAANPLSPVTLLDLPELLEKHRPDLVVLDPMTGLLPRSLHGQPMTSWDLNNDAANQMCQLLRGLAARYGTTILLVHHTGRDVTRYRGATDWWASVDAMFGLEPDHAAGTIRVKPEKCRDGRLLPPFLLSVEYGDDTYRVEFEGNDRQRLTPTAELVFSAMPVEAPISAVELFSQVPKSRSTVQKGIAELVDKGLARPTGEKTPSGSPLYERIPEVPPGAATIADD